MKIGTAIPTPLVGWPSERRSLIAVLLGSVVAIAIGYGSYRYDSSLASGWFAIGCFAAVAVTQWRRTGPPRSIYFWGGMVAVAAMVFLAGFVLGVPPGRAAWVMAVQALAGWLLVAMLRNSYGRTLVVPRSNEELVWAIVGMFLVSGLVALAGGFPADTDRSWTPTAVFSWTARFFVGMVTTLVPLGVLFFWRRSPLPVVTQPIHIPALVIAAMGAPLLAFGLPNLSLSWVLLVVALWAGMVFSPAAASLFALFSTTLTWLIGSVLLTANGGGRLVATSIVIDLMISASAALAIMVAIYRDQGARWQNRTQDQAGLLTAVFESVKDGIVLIGDNNQVTLINGPARELLGRDWPAGPPEVWASSLDMRTEDGARLLDADEIESLLPTSESDSPMTPVVLGASGELPERHLDLTTQRVDTGEDEDSQLMLTLHDVTAERRRQSELMHFARTVAHDLRTPLAGIQGWLELAQESVEDGDAAMTEDALKRGLMATRRATDVIEDWLAYSITHDGTLHPSAVKLRDVAQVVLDPSVVGSLPEGSQIRVSTPHSVYADRGLVVRMFANIVSNSIKYAKPGQPVKITMTSRETDHGWVEVAIADQGLGFETGDEATLFGEYQRGSRDKGYRPGTGLGLSLCRSIVLRHGGWIAAERNPHGGATIRFTLPGVPPELASKRTSQRRRPAPQQTAPEQTAPEQTGAQQATPEQTPAEH